MKLGSESLAMTSAKLNMAKTCDRKTATMKQHARGLVAVTKTDILTACDLKKALESNGGVKGCRVSIVEMPQRFSQIDTNVKIKGIS